MNNRRLVFAAKNRNGERISLDRFGKSVLTPLHSPPTLRNLVLLAHQAFTEGRPLRLGPLCLLVAASARQLFDRDELTSLIKRVPHLSIKTKPNLVIQAGKKGSVCKIVSFEPSLYGFEAAKCYIMPLLGDRTRLSATDGLALFDRVLCAALTLAFTCTLFINNHIPSPQAKQPGASSLPKKRGLSEEFRVQCVYDKPNGLRLWSSYHRLYLSEAFGF